MAESVVRLPNLLDTWPGVSETLRKICEGEVKDVETFEKLYATTDCNPARAVYGPPKFVALRRVLRDRDHVSEAHFLGTLLPWIAAKALEVEDLFIDHNHQLPVIEA